MCTYCGTNNYRKIYERHHGPILKESNGRAYEVHHIDGNHQNNSPSNLKLVTLSEHYDIHYKRGDFGACALMGKRMNLSPIEISTLAKLNVEQQFKNGTHPFSGGKLQHDRVKNGTHNFLGGEMSRQNNTNRVNDGTHNFLNKCGEIHHNYDSTKYNFINIITGEQATMTQLELIKKYNLQQPNVNKVVNRIRKTHRGWQLRYTV